MFNLSLKLFWREVKSGQLSVMIIALLIAVTSVSCISLFTDRLQNALMLETQEFLGGDLKFDSSQELNSRVLSKISSKSLKISKAITFASMISSREYLQLSSVKAVDSFYPLVGTIELISFKSNEVVELKSAPNIASVWLDQRLIDLLKVRIGDSVEIGNASFLVSHILITEPDRGSSAFAFAPKAIINYNDLKKTGILQPGSRVRFSYLFLGDNTSVNFAKEQLNLAKEPGDQLTEIGSNQGSIGNAVKKSENFFILGGLLSVLMAAFTVGISSQKFARRHISYVAVLKSLGSNSLELKKLYILIFSELAIVSILIGLLFGWIIQDFFIYLLRDYFPINLPDASSKPFIISALTVIICLIGFSFPHIVKLLKISPVTILRKQRSFAPFSYSVYIAISLLAIFLLLLVYTENMTLSMIIFLTIGTVYIIGTACIYLIFFSKPAEGLRANNPMNLAWSELRRRKLSNSIQIISFAVAIGLSLIAFVVKTELVNSWEKSLPPESPNNFAININQIEISSLTNFLEKSEIKPNYFYPIANGRISKIQNSQASKNSSSSIDRTFNITWTKKLPEKNKITSGEWFDEKSTNGLSISEEIALRYTLKVGDKVKVNLADQSIETTIQSIRKVNWESFTPNFFVIGHPDLFGNTPSTYITSFYIPKNKGEVISKFMEKFRTVSLFSIESLIKQVKDIVDQVSRALEIIMFLTIISAIFLTIATIQDGFSLRIHQAAVLRTLGASNLLLRRSTFIEFSFIGIFAGLLASILAQLSLYFLETRIFDIEDPLLHLSLLYIGPLSGFFVIGFISLFLIRSVTQKSPKEILFKA